MMDGFQSAVLEDSSAAFALSSPPCVGTRISPRIFLGAVRAADLALMLAAGLAVFLMLRDQGQAAHWDGRGLVAALLATWATGRGLRWTNVYSLARLRPLLAPLVSLVVPLILGTLANLICLLLLDLQSRPALIEALSWMGATGLLLAGSRVILSQVLASPSMEWRLSRRIVIFGANAVSQRFIERLHSDRASTDKVVAVFDDRRSRIPEYHAGVPVLGRIDDLLETGRREPIDAIVVALPMNATARLGEVCSALKPSVSDIYVTADLAGERAGTAGLAHLGPNPVIVISRRPLDEWAVIQKRGFDLVVGALVLILIAPVMCLIALAIRVDSEGPVFFRQMRRGLNNNDFLVLKFRTMHDHLGDFGGQRQAVRNDPRVTKVGRVLRKLSFDELPQLFNVLRGDMSLVGPRPHALSTRAGDLPLDEAVSDYAMRHRVKPGITGWAQVNGFRGAIRNEAQLRSRVECDLYYINNWSLWFDIKIMFMTLNAKRHTRNAF